MNAARTISRREFVDFVFSEPDDRELDYGGNLFDDKCLCPMAAFAKSIGMSFTAAAQTGWYKGREDIAVFERGTRWDTFYFHGVENYGQLKAKLREEGLKPSPPSS